MGFFTLSSCGNDASSENAKKEVNEATEAVGDAMESERNDLKREIMEAQSNIDRRLEKLNNDMKEAKDDAKADIQKDIDKLEAKKKRLAEDLDNFGEKTGQEWDQFKANVRETFKDIGTDNN
ncbi:MAG: hypothetical protein IPM82_21210 [Saprospiraceae bacterium]|nr:hypothetical protein [Saprospiraceae bacterium]